MLFTNTIKGWSEGDTSWAAVFQSIEAFAPLIHELARRHRLPECEISHLTPGSNAVFRMGEYVYKIFAPIESGTSTITDYRCELAGMKHAADASVALPKVIANGCLQDRYLFNYIVMEYIDAKEAKDALPNCSDAEKRSIARLLKEDLSRMNTPYFGDEPLPGIRLSDMDRWRDFPEKLMDEWKAVRSSIRDELVFVHGDLTEDNVLLKGGRFMMLDFADCHVAPVSYEWPALVFGLLACDPVMLDVVFDAWRSGEFVQRLSVAMLWHDFGAAILKGICQDVGMSFRDIDGLDALKQVIRRRLGI